MSTASYLAVLFMTEQRKPACQGPGIMVFLLVLCFPCSIVWVQVLRTCLVELLPSLTAITVVSVVLEACKRHVQAAAFHMLRRGQPES